MKALLYIVYIFCFSFSQHNSDHIKVIEHKKSWKAYRAGVEIPKSHFFNILNDEYHRDPVSYTHLRAHRDATLSRMPSSA